MKITQSIFGKLTLISVLFCLVLNARADIIKDNRGVELRAVKDVESPQEMIRSFLDSLILPPCTCDTFHYDAADNVMGANPEDRHLKSVHKTMIDKIGEQTIEASGFTIIPDPQDAKLAKVNFVVTFSDDALGYEFKQQDSVNIKLETNKKGQSWKIIPLKPDFYLEQFDAQNTLSRKSTFTNFWASEIAYPQEMQNRFNLYMTEAQLQDIGRALMMLSQDYDEKFAFTKADYVEKLTPYLKKQTSFTAPGNSPDTVSFHINPHIMGLSRNEIKQPQTLVAFYLGKDQKLNFRFGDISAVLFADGHVESITPQKAKDLRWKP